MIQIITRLKVLRYAEKVMLSFQLVPRTVRIDERSTSSYTD